MGGPRYSNKKALEHKRIHEQTLMRHAHARTNLLDRQLQAGLKRVGHRDATIRVVEDNTATAANGQGDEDQLVSIHATSRQSREQEPVHNTSRSILNAATHVKAGIPTAETDTQRSSMFVSHQLSGSSTLVSSLQLHFMPDTAVNAFTETGISSLTRSTSRLQHRRVTSDSRRVHRPWVMRFSSSFLYLMQRGSDEENRTREAIPLGGGEGMKACGEIGCAITDPSHSAARNKTYSYSTLTGRQGNAKRTSSYPSSASPDPSLPWQSPL